MRKKRYIESATKLIVNRIKFHAPILYDDDVDLDILLKNGIEMKKPIFKFEKNLNGALLKAFELAQKDVDFTLVLCRSSLGKTKEKALQKIDNLFVVDECTPARLLQSINKLNINYPSSSNFNLDFREKFFKIGGRALNPHFDDFCLRQVAIFDNIFVDYSEFVLNGNNHFAILQNKSELEKKVEIELNIPLEKGYYFFKRLPKTILVENVLTKTKRYLNFVCRNAKFSFSMVDGLENSVFCCVNVKATLTLKPNEDGFVFFNFGESKFSLGTQAGIGLFKQIAWQKSCEIFNLQIKTKNPKFDYLFNHTLPQKIWINWLNGEVDEKLEEKYLTYKRLFLKEQKIEPRPKWENANSDKSGLTLVNFKEIGLKEVGIFNGEYYKRIFIVKGDERFLRVGKTFFYNINGITENSLKSKQPISVCFGVD